MRRHGRPTPGIIRASQSCMTCAIWPLAEATKSLHLCQRCITARTASDYPRFRQRLLHPGAPGFYLPRFWMRTRAASRSRKLARSHDLSAHGGRCSRMKAPCLARCEHHQHRAVGKPRATLSTHRTTRAVCNRPRNSPRHRLALDQAPKDQAEPGFGRISRKRGRTRYMLPEAVRH